MLFEPSFKLFPEQTQTSFILVESFYSLFFRTHPHPSGLILILQYSPLSFSTHPYHTAVLILSPLGLILIINITHPHPSVLFHIIQYSSSSLKTHPYPSVRILSYRFYLAYSLVYIIPILILLSLWSILISLCSLTHSNIVIHLFTHSFFRIIPISYPSLLIRLILKL